MNSIICMICASNERKDNILQETLQSFKESDWPTEPICVFSGNTSTNRHECIHNNSYNLLSDFYDSGYNYLLYCEDDIHVNRHIYHNLTTWAPIKYGFLVVGSLYDTLMPNYFNSDLALRSDNRYRMGDTCNMWGAQGIVIKRDIVPYLLERWAAIPGFPDTKIPRLIQGIYSVCFYHQPSLVQHRCPASLFDLKTHQCANYDGNFKA